MAVTYRRLSHPSSMQPQNRLAPSGPQAVPASRSPVGPSLAPSAAPGAAVGTPKTDHVPAPQPPRLLDQVRGKLRVLHYAIRT